MVSDDLDKFSKNHKKPTTFEDIYETIGGLGCFQIFALCVTLFPQLPGAMIDFQPVFTASHPTKWLCKNDFGQITDVTNDPAGLCSCNGTLDGGNESIVAEWRLVCGYSWVADFVTSVQMFGLIFGDMLGMFMIDSWGRKRALFIGSFVAMFGSMAASVAPNIVLYAMGRFLSGIGISCILITSSVYPIEFLTPKWRALCGAVGPWGEGVMALSLAAYFFHPWRQLCFYTALPMLAIFWTYPFLPESPRYLLLKGKTKEAGEVLNQIARWNGSPPPDPQLLKNLADSLHQSDNEVANGDDEKEEFWMDKKIGGKPMKISLLNCWQYPIFFRKTLIFMICWFTCLLLYYGIGFNTKNLRGDPYMNVFYMALAEMVGLRSTIFVSRWIGRRKSFVLYMGLATGCMVNIICIQFFLSFYPMFVAHNSQIVFNTFVFGGQTMASAALAIITCFTAESYSTNERSLGVGLANVAASLAAIIAPQMAYIGSFYTTGPYFMFAACGFLSTASILLLVETDGKPLRDI